jgi:hypothetical protein
MTTMMRPESEWTAPSLRPTARWVPVITADGHTRMEMIWSLPAVDVPQAAPAA